MAIGCVKLTKLMWIGPDVRLSGVCMHSVKNQGNWESIGNGKWLELRRFTGCWCVHAPACRGQRTTLVSFHKHLPTGDSKVKGSYSFITGSF